MKSLSFWISFLVMLVFTFCLCVLAYATDDLTQVLPANDFFGLAWNSIKGVKGASALGITVLVVQVIMYFFRSELATWSGKWRLVTVYGLSLIFGIMTMITAGIPWQECLFHVQTLAAFQVFLNQLWKQLVTEKGNKV